MSPSRPVRTLEDLERTVRAIATEFKTDKIFIIGSQSILLAWPDAPPVMRTSPEIDAFSGQRKDLGSPGEGEASRGIPGGIGTYRCLVPAGWQTRAVVRRVDVGTVTAVAPCPEDIIVSKLARLDDKDKSFIEAYHSARALDPHVIEERIRLSNFESPIADRALAYIRNLTQIGGSGGGATGGPPP
jgi:hypothetical protein